MIKKLTDEEDKVWIKTFQYYKDEGYSDIEADKKTFQDLIKEFPRLKNCEKIK